MNKRLSMKSLLANILDRLLSATGPSDYVVGTRPLVNTSDDTATIVMSYGKTLLYKRSPVLCVYTTQQGDLYMFTIFSSEHGTPSSVAWVKSAVSPAPTLTVKVSGNNVTIKRSSGSWSWGQGFAIGRYKDV